MHVTHFVLIGIFSLCFECIQSKSILSESHAHLHKPRTLDNFVTCLKNCANRLSKDNSLNSFLYKRHMLSQKSTGSDLDKTESHEDEDETDKDTPDENSHSESHEDKSHEDKGTPDEGSYSASSASSGTSRTSASLHSDSSAYGSWYCHDLCWKTSSIFG